VLFIFSVAKVILWALIVCGIITAIEVRWGYSRALLFSQELLRGNGRGRRQGFNVFVQRGDVRRRVFTVLLFGLVSLAVAFVLWRFFGVVGWECIAGCLIGTVWLVIRERRNTLRIGRFDHIEPECSDYKNCRYVAVFYDLTRDNHKFGLQLPSEECGKGVCYANLRTGVNYVAIDVAPYYLGCRRIS